MMDDEEGGERLVVQGNFCKIIDVVRRNYVFKACKWEMSNYDY
jgi:hypothetical protein